MARDGRLLDAACCGNYPRPLELCIPESQDEVSFTFITSNCFRSPPLSCDARETRLWYFGVMNASDRTPHWIVDLKTREVLKCNESAASLWGYEPQEMVGISAEKLIHTDELERADRKSTRLNSSHIPLSRMPH